jgi:hypothetical protein
MAAMKRELERIAETTLFSSYEAIREEFKKAEGLGATAETYALIVDMARILAPSCECGADYFEGIRD